MEMDNTNQPETPVQPISNPVHNQKGFFPIILGVLVLLLVVGGGAYYLGTQNSRTINQTSQQPAPSIGNSTNTPMVTNIPNNNWKTYTSGNLTFNYPESFSIKSDSNNKVIFIQSEEPFKGLPFLEVSINDTLSYRKLRQCKVQPNYYENDEGDCYVQFEKKQINKINGYKYLFIPKGASNSIVVFETVSSPYAEFKYYCYGGGCDNNLNQIVSTLELKR